MEQHSLSAKDSARFWKNVRKSDSCWEWFGYKNQYGYGRISIGGRAGRQYSVHRVSWSMANGVIEDGLQIDHICHNPACVNPAHLRATTNKQNNENVGGLRADNTSGHQGVMWDKRDKLWRAYANHNGRYYSAGYHKTKEEAAEAARLKRLELFTHNDLDRTTPQGVAA